MKKLILIVAICSLAGAGYGQKKPKINQAEKARTDGELAEAKQIVDEAIEHEKTKDDGKTWYYRGLVYATLDTTSNPEFQNLADNPLETAMEAFAKADEIDPEGNKYYITNDAGLPVLKDQQLNVLWGHYLNQGVEAYQSENTEDAVKYFTKTQVIQPKDTTGYIYAGLAAQSGKDYETAAKNYYVLIDDLDYHSKDIYNSLIYIEGSVNKDDEAALAIVRKAKEQFPDNIDFAKTEINTLIRMDKVDEAKAEIEGAIEKEPDNPELYFTLGVMYEELDNKEKAQDAYQQAIDADPDFYNAVFNLAVLNYNVAVDLIKEKNNLGISQADQKKAKEMQKTIDAKLKAAVPHWEKANELQPNDRTTLETLQYIYNQLGMDEKLVKVSKQLKTMDGEQ
ncbi:tetratricopeptide repeat protein [Fulvivirga sp. RKSG066]|uniref:tetratricopeptide repeat protein n=1 Tax=Fulvivirga aurantia TaxID=2529383 RepID=UPI0012BB4CCB|nr:tetratricopeptide repeat protein [Fulvivirga aurantia]MTI22533.1 tetratricopeptide repeat protein [Fulvivirga aurantia]